MHGLQITDGSNVIELDDWGFEVEDIRINLPEQENLFAEIEGVSGRSLQSSVHKTTTIEVDLRYNYDFDLDFPLLRDKLIGLVSGTKPFYIREKWARETKVKFEQPGEKTGNLDLLKPVYASGKRYLVLRTGSGTFERSARDGSGTVTFETANLPYSESVGRSMDIHRNGITYENGLWSYGMGLTKDASSWIYSFTNQASVRVYNPSDVDIDDLKMDRIIRVKFNQSASSFSITGNDGLQFLIERPFASGDVLTIDRHYVKVNGVNVLGSVTKLNYPVIYKGWNTFTLAGATNVTIDFDFKFYYGGGNN